jgi:8-oxo-dGTP diphosphatase
MENIGIHDMEIKMRPGIGVGVLVERNGSYLLIKRNKSPGRDAWAPPGGHLEFRESFEDCAIREAMEETNISVANPTFIGVTNDLHPEADRHGVTVWMKADYKSGEALNTCPDEVAEISWVEKNKLPANLFCPFKQLMEGTEYK